MEKGVQDLDIDPFSQQNPELRSPQAIQIRRGHTGELFSCLPVQEPEIIARAWRSSGVDLCGVQPAVKRIREALPEPALRPVQAIAPVARALVEEVFSLEYCALDF